MKCLLLSLAGLMLTVLPLYAEESEPSASGDLLLMEQLSADDIEMLQMVELLELLDLLGDIDTLVRLEDES